MKANLKKHGYTSVLMEKADVSYNEESLIANVNENSPYPNVSADQSNQSYSKSDNDIRYDVERPWIIKRKNGKEEVNKGMLVNYLKKSDHIIVVSRQFYYYEYGAFIPKDEDEMVDIISRYIPVHLQDYTLELSIYKSLRTKREINRKVENLNSHENYINIKNGMYNIVTGGLEPHSTKYLSTVQINATFDTNAKGENFLKYLDKVVPDKMIQQLLKEMLAHCLTVGYPLRYFVLLGPSRSGKSTFIEVINSLFEKVFISHIPLHDMKDDNKVAHIADKILNTFTDLDDSPIRNVAAIKALSEGEGITVRPIYRKPFEFENKAKFVFGSNHLPEFICKDLTPILNRMIIVPFENVVPENERISKALFKKILTSDAERNFILMWALEGLRDLIEQNYRFTIPERSQEIMDEYLSKGTVVEQFFNKNFVYDSSSYIEKTKSYELYCEFCKDSSRQPLPKKEFYQFFMKCLPSISIERRGKNRQEAFTSIRLTID